MTEELSPQPLEDPTEIAHRAFAKLKRRVLWGVALLLAVYYNIYAIPMVLHTLFPFAVLGAVGFALGYGFPRNTKAASWAVFALVAAATVFRRAVTINVPLAEEIFGGALSQGGYPPWAAWLAELLRLRVYLAALRLGTGAGGQLRAPPSTDGESAPPTGDPGKQGGCGSAGTAEGGCTCS